RLLPGLGLWFAGHRQDRARRHPEVAIRPRDFPKPVRARASLVPRIPVSSLRSMVRRLVGVELLRNPFEGGGGPGRWLGGAGSPLALAAALARGPDGSDLLLRFGHDA